ncbi:MAG: type IX secretion system membrane protein PorP/SprF [Chitinophagaceae bacterium]|nr:type IX secretion system membrane protein PorP/SprF [Chitinophagaceae bacterium]
MNIKNLGICLFLLIVQNGISQDIQFSQYYFSPLYLNPGLVGVNQKGKIGLNYRNQWPNIKGGFETFSFFADHHIEKYNSSVGLLFVSNRESLVGLQSNTIAIQYSYQLELTYTLVFRPAIEISYNIRDINFDKLLFGDQFDNTGRIKSVSDDIYHSGRTVQYPDVALGFIFYSKSLWLGFSYHNITEPNQSYTIGGESILPKRLSLHGGYKLYISPKNSKNIEKEISISPSFYYRTQGNFHQLDIGTYFQYKNILFGTWYRGIPITSFQGYINNESIIFMVGMNKKALTIAYSFDYTISQLGIGGGGAHELSLLYSFTLGDSKKPPRHIQELLCPVPFIF